MNKYLIAASIVGGLVARWLVFSADPAGGQGDARGIGEGALDSYRDSGTLEAIDDGEPSDHATFTTAYVAPAQRSFAYSDSVDRALIHTRTYRAWRATRSKRWRTTMMPRKPRTTYPWP